MYIKTVLSILPGRPLQDLATYGKLFTCSRKCDCRVFGGSGACFGRVGRRFLLLVFEVWFQTIKPAADCFGDRDGFLGAVLVKNLLRFLIDFDADLERFGVVGLGTSFFAHVQRITSLFGWDRPIFIMSQTCCQQKVEIL